MFVDVTNRLMHSKVRYVAKLKFGCPNSKTNFYFQAYKGQITALLGHNGAGKSTTMNVLTGMLSPSDGSAQINGFNIGNEMNMVGFFY